MHKTVIGISLFALIHILAGCSSIHFYDQSADKLATDAKAGYEDSKIVDALKTEQASFDALEKKEVDAFLKVIAVQRDLELLALLSDTGGSFVDRFTTAVAQRLAEITDVSTNSGKVDMDGVTARLGEITAARNTIEHRKRLDTAQRAQLAEVEPKLAKLPACEAKNDAVFKGASAGDLAAALDDKSFVPGAELLNLYAQYVGQVCRPVLVAEKRLKDLFKGKGELEKAAQDAAARAGSLSEKQAAAKEAQAALKKAAKAEADARKTASDAAKLPDLTCKPNEDKDQQQSAAAAPAAGTTAKDDKGAQGREQAASPPNQICVALANLRKLGDLGLKLISEEQIANIDLTLVALSGSATQEDGKALPPGLALLSTVVRFAGALEQYRNAGTLPALEPLLIEKQLSAARLAYANQGYELEKLRVALAREKVDALLLELDLLLQARAQLGGIPKPAAACTPTSDAAYCVPASRLIKAYKTALKPNVDPPGRIAYRALAYFAESFTVARARYQSADLKLILSDYRDSLNRSQAALASWDALVATPLAQLQTYYASGIKPDDIARFLQAFGVVGIAAQIK